MKNIFFIIALSFLINISFSQRVEHFEKHKCSHGHTEHLKAGLVYNLAMNNYDINFYFIDLEVSSTTEFIQGNTFIKAIAVNDLDTFIIQLDNSMNIDSILFDDINVAYQHSSDEISIIIPTITVNTYFTVQVFYSGTSAGGGLTSGNWSGAVPNTTWTLSESFHAKEWFPAKEVLSDKADSLYVFITVDNSLKAGSNGILTAITPVGGTKSRYEWKSYYPINYYLISLAVSEYEEYNFYAHPAGITDSVLVQNYVYDIGPGNLEDIDQTADLIELFSELYGMYPFKDEKYGHCQAPLNGAMEHQTMTTTGYFSFWLIAHELGHQWFGDNVTCATWQDIWINEGFASYTEYLANQFLVSQAEADNWMVAAHDYAMDEPLGTIYIPLADAMNESRIFSNALSYKKGASIVHMIRFMLDNDTLFFDILADFQTDFKDSVATGADFRDFLNTNSSIDFTDFFDQWYYGEGFPTYNVIWSHINDTVTLDVEQTTSSAVTPFFGNDMEYKIIFDTGDTTFRVSQTQNIQQYKFHITNTVTGIEVDPVNWVLNAPGVIFTNTNIKDISDQLNIYPNPFAGKTTIRFAKPLSGEYDLAVYDITGSMIKHITNLNGTHIELDLSNFENGIYIGKLLPKNSKGNTVEFKLILSK